MGLSNRIIIKVLAVTSNNILDSEEAIEVNITKDSLILNSSNNNNNRLSSLTLRPTIHSKRISSKSIALNEPVSKCNRIIIVIKWKIRQRVSLHLNRKLLALVSIGRIVRVVGIRRL